MSEYPESKRVFGREWAFEPGGVDSEGIPDGPDLYRIHLDADEAGIEIVTMGGDHHWWFENMPETGDVETALLEIRDAIDAFMPDEQSLRARLSVLEGALTKVNTIRNSIVAKQGFNFSEHAYPLVAALDEAGFEGMPYPEALAYFGTMLERTLAAESRVKALAVAYQRFQEEADDEGASNAAIETLLAAVEKAVTP